jgi:predicted RNA methylase
MSEFMRLAPLPWSDYEGEYGFVNYEGKVVLDVGADYGSTAAYFLRKGALRVVAVEADDAYFEMLTKNIVACANGESRVTAVHCVVSNPEQFEGLICAFRPDIVKVDCEGCEVSLLQIPDRVFSSVPEYIMEIHSDDLYDRFIEKFGRLGYSVDHADNWTVGVWVIHAKRVS